MKLALFLCFISVAAFAQVKKEKPVKKNTADTLGTEDMDKTFEELWNGVKYRQYSPDECRCPQYKPGDRFPDSHPNAKYLNDTTLWEWRDVDFGNGMHSKVFDLKQQYKDTLHTYDGDVVEVPVWLKNPNWKKPVDSTQLKSKKHIL
jgi:hypothetical protein